MQPINPAIKQAPSSKLAIIAVAVVHQLFFLGLAVGIRLVAPEWLDIAGIQANFHVDRPLDIWSGFLTWDSHFYQYIATNGYQAGHISLAFYPLWPALIASCTELFGGDVLCVSIALATLIGALAIVAFHRLAFHILGSAQNANRATACLLCYPGSFFLSVPYSEPLFVLLFVFFLNACIERKYSLSFLIGLCLPLSRSVGVLALLYPLLLWFYRRERRLMLPIAGIILGYLSYLATMQVFAGDLFAGYLAGQNFIFKPSFARVINVWDTLGNLLHVEHLHSFQYSLVDRLVIIVGLFGLYGLRSQSPLLILSIAMLWVSAATQFGSAMIRFLLATVPVFIGLGKLRLPSAIFIVLAIAGFTLKIYFFIRFISGYWVA